MGRIERTGPKPISKYQRKLAARNAELAGKTGTVEPDKPPETTTWEVTGTISKIPTKGYFFVQTEKAERVFVATELLGGNLTPHEDDQLRCRVFRNEHGLRASAVLEYRPCS